MRRNNEGPFFAAQRKKFESMLAELVEIPSVSADPAHKKDVAHAATCAASFLRSFGATTRIHKTKGNPVVVGRFNHPKAERTITVYNHLDVQPADEPDWKRPPFHFIKKGDRYFGRGSTDDKGPALTALFAAKYAVESGLPINIQFIWELEEEIGSPHFEEFLKANRRSLKTDSIVVIDSVWISASQPCLFYALRGNVAGSMFLETADRTVHSGVAGGVARNPIHELCRVASQCYDPKAGKVLIPGFYQDAVKPSAKERSNFARSGFHLKSWAKSYGLKRIQTENTREALLRIWCRPTFEVHGIVGGYTGPGVKTAIPPRAELKFSCRLAPGQDPRKAAASLKRYVAQINPDVRLELRGGIYPYLGEFSGPYADAAAAAVRYGFSKSPAFVRAGGSDGAIVLMKRHLKAPLIMMGLSLPEHGYHAPNENFDWKQAFGGVKMLVKYFEQVSAIRTDKNR